MKKSYQALAAKRRFIAGKLIVGIDPGKFSHQAVVQDEHGIQLGKSFPFAQSYAGYHQSLPRKLGKIIPATPAIDVAKLNLTRMGRPSGRPDLSFLLAIGGTVLFAGQDLYLSHS